MSEISITKLKSSIEFSKYKNFNKKTFNNLINQIYTLSMTKELKESKELKELQSLFLNSYLIPILPFIPKKYKKKLFLLKNISFFLPFLVEYFIKFDLKTNFNIFLDSELFYLKNYKKYFLLENESNSKNFSFYDFLRIKNSFFRKFEIFIKLRQILKNEKEFVKIYYLIRKQNLINKIDSFSKNDKKCNFSKKKQLKNNSSISGNEDSLKNIESLKNNESFHPEKNSLKIKLLNLLKINKNYDFLEKIKILKKPLIFYVKFYSKFYKFIKRNKKIFLKNLIDKKDTIFFILNHFLNENKLFILNINFIKNYYKYLFDKKNIFYIFFRNLKKSLKFEKDFLSKKFFVSEIINKILNKNKRIIENENLIENIKLLNNSLENVKINFLKKILKKNYKNYFLKSKIFFSSFITIEIKIKKIKKLKFLILETKNKKFIFKVKKKIIFRMNYCGEDAIYLKLMNEEVVFCRKLRIRNDRFNL